MDVIQVKSAVVALDLAHAVIAPMLVGVTYPMTIGTWETHVIAMCFKLLGRKPLNVGYMAKTRA
jgi:hypothetical protein